VQPRHRGPARPGHRGRGAGGAAAGRHEPIAQESGTAMIIDTCEPVELGGITQWIRIRGTDPANPVLLLMQHGPGAPIINEARRFERLLRLEEAFTVVYWDQRGTGLALRNRGAEVSAERMVADTVTLLELLRDRF